MSIDLTLTGTKPVAIGDFIQATADFGEQLLRCPLLSALLEKVTSGCSTPVPNEVGVVDTMLVVRWAGFTDRVAIVAVEGEDDAMVLTFSVGATRHPTEYALGLIAACALATLWGCAIVDDNQFWTATGALEPADVLDSLSVNGYGFKDACEELLQRRNPNAPRPPEPR